MNAKSLVQLAAAALLTVTLTGCDTVGSWFKTEKVPLPGERISVLALEGALEPDESVQDLAVTLPPQAPNADWPSAAGSAAGVMGHLALPENISRAWSADIGTGSDSEERVTARPIVAGGRIFTMDSRAKVSAFDQRTGERLWQVGLARRSEDVGEIGGGMAYGQGRLVVTTGYGDMYALEPETGHYFWKATVDGPIRGAPLVHNGRVFFLASENRLKAHDLETGKEIWVHQGLQETAELIGAPSPTASGPFVMAPYSSGEIYALRADTGQSIWSDQLVRARRVTPLGAINDIDGEPVIDGDRVYVIGQGGIMAGIDLRRGVRLWDQDMAGREPPWVAGDFIYVVTSDSELVCISSSDGGIRWVKQLQKLEDPDDTRSRVTWQGPILAGGRLVLGNNLGDLAFFSPYDGTQMRKIDLGSGVAAAPIVVDGTLYVVTDGGNLVAFR